jgi:ubiquinone/menaquinone biosynthesis C-methylase UbiE
MSQNNSDLISKKYLKQQRYLHTGTYGVSGDKYANLVYESGFSNILDYGCGARRLEYALGFPITNYDPAIAGLEHNNTPHDFVYCGDVLEHIEPEYLDNVLADIKRCMKVAGLLVISTVKAEKHLPDGRNAHLIIKNAEWWTDKVSGYFTIVNKQIKKDECLVWVSVTG